MMTRQMPSTVSSGQKPLVALGQRPHHRGLAAGPEGGAGFGGLLHGDQPVDDRAALHEEPVHRLVDAVDLLAQIGKGRERACRRTWGILSKSVPVRSPRHLGAAVPRIPRLPGRKVTGHARERGTSAAVPSVASAELDRLFRRNDAMLQASRRPLCSLTATAASELPVVRKTERSPDHVQRLPCLPSREARSTIRRASWRASARTSR